MNIRNQEGESARISEIFPAFSLVVTCYNLENYIRKSLVSVFEQDYPGEMQVVVVDDCSTDASWQVIQETVAEHGQGRDVLTIRNEENMGVAGATDSGWSRAKHDWIIMVDGDDIQYPNRCRLTAELLRDYPESDVISLSSRSMGPKDEDWGYLTPYAHAAYDSLPKCIYVRKEEVAANWLRVDGRPKVDAYGCSMAIRRSLYLRWGPLLRGGKKRNGAQDVIWLWRAQLSGNFCGSLGLACRYRMHASNILNRVRGQGVAGMMEWDRVLTRYCALEWLSLEQKMEDLERCIREPQLTAWTSEQLEEARHRLAQERNSLAMRINWWDVSWFERLGRAFRFKGKVPPSFKHWPWIRLLPLAVFCMLKRLKHLCR